MAEQNSSYRPAMSPLTNLFGPNQSDPFGFLPNPGQRIDFGFPSTRGRTGRGDGGFATFMSSAPQAIAEGKQVFGPKPFIDYLLRNQPGGTTKGGFGSQVGSAIQSDYAAAVQANEMTRSAIDNFLDLSAGALEEQRMFTDQGIGDMTQRADTRFTEKEAEIDETAMRMEEAAQAREDMGDEIIAAQEAYTKDVERFGKNMSSNIQRIMGRTQGKVSRADNEAEKFYLEAASIMDNAKEELDKNMNVAGAAAGAMRFFDNAETALGNLSGGIGPDGTQLSATQMASQANNIRFQTGARVQENVGKLQREEAVLNLQLDTNKAQIMTRLADSKSTFGRMYAQAAIAEGQALAGAEQTKFQALTFASQGEAKAKMQASKLGVDAADMRAQSSKIVSDMKDQNFGAHRAFSIDAVKTLVASRNAMQAGYIQLAGFMAANPYSIVSQLNPLTSWGTIMGARGISRVPDFPGQLS